MTQPNLQFQRARKQLSSPSAPGESASRQDIADLANAWIYDMYRREGGLNRHYIGKLERGEVRWPNSDYRAALRHIFGVERDSDLGFHRPQRTKSASEPAITEEDVDRKGFIRTALGAAAAVSLVELSEPASPARSSGLPAVVTEGDIRKLRHIAGVFSSWDHTYGGGLVREAVAAQLRYSVGLLRHSRCPNSLRNDLFSAVGHLGHVAAFMAFDSFSHDDARRMFGMALGCAEEAGDWHLRAKILSSMARQAIWTGDADNGLTLIEFAMVRSDRLTPAERAMLMSARARALAKLGRVQETLATVGRGDEEFARVKPSEEPPWMRYYDAAQHAGDTGHALYDLAINGKFVSEATGRLASAVAGHTSAYVRSRAISGIKLASLTMVTGDPVEAAHIGARALTDAGTVRSRRAQTDMEELSRLALPHQRHGQVVELRRRITEATRS
ncbi:hypothetical protein HNP84_007859 [Thermocatellispora tengchongensis]|uniref:XRE family transcriptional regulator n=1 Tax=Thermocatellispora tengchongensis TaxID=1073253 RepID=A0A840PGZ9_9ACTN|nr:XRE family transcriptional regulator [Thermocatellispora tengchongensis]MBB5138106.1 hypothetical protein [Thermocatellispora tengchongensis]